MSIQKAGHQCCSDPKKPKSRETLGVLVARQHQQLYSRRQTALLMPNCILDCSKTMLGALLAACFLILSARSSDGQMNNASSGLLLVANKGEHTLGIIDVASGRQIAAVAEDGITGHEVAASP